MSPLEYQEDFETDHHSFKALNSAATSLLGTSKLDTSQMTSEEIPEVE